ncbi:esterase/lipase family protein [Moraxella sp. ZJ142]|uniref:esterase/lipase family protein n=1 Tax=Moraxella marmotae TaxID=3344520 RepID=UPI0035D4A5F4
MNTPLTILIHGLHMNPWYMKPLAKKLSRAGLATYCYGYPSLRQSVAQHSQGLHDYLTQHHDPKQPIHLVGHSLGGLVMRHFLANHRQWQVQHCVTLGTPHTGSQVARYAYQYLPMLVKPAYAGALDGTCPLPPADTKIGVIAGNRPVGLGLPFIALHRRRHRLTAADGEHDGTVFVSETRLESACDYLVLPVSHTGLMTNDAVAKQVIYFLQHGQFWR